MGVGCDGHDCKLESGRDCDGGCDGGKWVGKGANLGQPQGDRDLKLPWWWAGEEWGPIWANPKVIALWVGGRMGKLKMGESGEIAMGENEWGKGVRKLEMKGMLETKIRKEVFEEFKFQK
ncbi:uncharacterized protein Gasu_63980 [Galdieria sulphuraria]|uniref:Uncharacterized protein n=1 Tax=Galdieria sulphuraria TaxID=130081 RepID=M2VS60_GALSU|nr:uncharacterized protein Gasu_63980 [Galdieria sulphuraria]EME25946.1 hypothetical protein Gasu_63980 [Galdieria sulphuraria]|eukprot:XP_005702466.1 hypothetical protein Gasu_63980 [Galdieria sulphuraria]